jgi:hypothetical protein|nr:MAG TPA: hypothetical protein [Bacteriophage sp.]DAS86365.1 MAG TPA: hypothetical protein [Bacteriophage sp.]
MEVYLNFKQGELEKLGQIIDLDLEESEIMLLLHIIQVVGQILLLLML